MCGKSGGVDCSYFSSNRLVTLYRQPNLSSVFRAEKRRSLSSEWFFFGKENDDDKRRERRWLCVCQWMNHIDCEWEDRTERLNILWLKYFFCAKDETHTQGARKDSRKGMQNCTIRFSPKTLRQIYIQKGKRIDGVNNWVLRTWHSTKSNVWKSDKVRLTSHA